MKGIELLTGLALALISASPRCEADPGIIVLNGTSYLKDADSYVGKAWLLPKILPLSKPSSSPSASPSPGAATFPVTERSGYPNKVVPIRTHPAAIIHRSKIIVGEQIPVPTQYAAPSMVLEQNNGVTVVPATPTAFTVIQTGATMGSDGNGTFIARDTEFNGFVNYGHPIRTVVPLQNQRGQTAGSQTIIVFPNPILAPVTTTVEMK